MTAHVSTRFTWSKCFADAHIPRADCNISEQTLMIRQEILKRIEGSDESFGILDDRDIAIRGAQQGFRIRFLATPGGALAPQKPDL